MYFSERYGFKDIRDIIQVNQIDEILANRLDNYLIDLFIYLVSERANNISSDYTNVSYDLYLCIMTQFFKESKLNISDYHEFAEYTHYITNILEYIQSEEWYIYYDVLEFMGYAIDNELLIELNKILEEENSNWRMSSSKLIIPVTDDVSMSTINKAQESSFNYARKHIRNAVEALSRRKETDINSIVRESINAVESALIEYSGEPENGKSTFGTAVNKLKSKNVDNKLLQFIQPFEKIYSISSNTGIRHGANSKAIDLTHDEAIFLLTMCSAIINYMSNKYLNR